MNNFKKTFTTIFIGQTISLLTSSIIQYAVIWYITFETHSAMNLAIATIAAIVPQIIIGPFAGVLVDRWDRKKIMIASDGMIAIATLILGILFIIGQPSLIGLYIVLAIRSLGAAFHTPSFQASIPLLAPKDKIVQLSGINQTIQAITLIAAPILAGILYGAIPIQYIVLLDIIGALFGIGSIMLVHIPKPTITNTEKPSILREMKDGVLEIYHSKFLFFLTIFLVLIQLCIMPIGTLFPLITSTYFHGSAFNASIIEVAFSAGMLLGGIVISVWGGFKKKQYTILFSVLVMGLVLTVSGLVPSNMFVLFGVATFLMGIMAPIPTALFTAILQIEIKPEKLGRVYSFVITLVTLATPIGLLVVAPIAEKVGVEKVFVFTGFVLVIICLVALRSKVIRTTEISTE